MEFEFTYGVARTVVFPLVKAGATDLAASADYTPAAGDSKLSKDGGAVANTTNTIAAVSGTGSVLWSLALTAAELEAAVVVVQIVDSATKQVEDQVLIGYAKDSDKIEVYQVTNASTAPTATAYEANRGLGRSEEATADHFNGRNVLFLSGALQGQMRDITDYALQNTRGFFTVTSHTEAPANGDRFLVL